MLNSYHCVKFFVHGVRAYSLIVFPPLFLQKSSRKSSFGIVSFRRRSAQQLGALREKSLSVRLRLGLFFFILFEPSQKWWGTYIYNRWMTAWKERTGKGCSTVRIRGYPPAPVRPSAHSLRVWSSRVLAAARRPSKAIMDFIKGKAEMANW